MTKSPPAAHAAMRWEHEFAYIEAYGTNCFAYIQINGANHLSGGDLIRNAIQSYL